MKEELKPCPFCGGRAYELNMGVGGKNIAVNTYCLNKADKCPIAAIYMTVKQWNARADTKEEKFDPEAPMPPMTIKQLERKRLYVDIVNSVKHLYKD